MTNKISRINEDIQRVMATLLRGIKDPRVNQGMISVTAVDTTSDLRHAKVFLSVLGLESEKDFIKGLKSASGYLRHELGQSLSLRYTPELQFELDRSIERGVRINTILNTIEIAEDDDDTDDDTDDGDEEGDDDTDGGGGGTEDGGGGGTEDGGGGGATGNDKGGQQ